MSTMNSENPDQQPAALQDRSIGDIIAEANSLSAEQVERILAHQKSEGLKFGEAAVALGLAKGEDVLWALSQQFHYPYAPGSGEQTREELVLANKPFSHQAEAIRTLRSQINMLLFGADMPRRALAVVSPEHGDGKTFFAANLAIAFSQLGGRTLLVDADMRSPRQHEVFGVDNSAGLSGILSGRAERNVIRPVPNLPSLFVMPVGTLPPNPTELVERPAFGLLIKELVGKFDHVIVDTPAACSGADYAVIAARCGAALLLARKGITRVAAVQELCHTLANSPVKLAGLVMNEH
ncbi:polysaccharide biosynthesis tyrosine autokinase [Roseateles sp.]|jgi:protein-tyrosine kinase|uniref:polysaccharide biosynthesis tyrosine autokinase n=1 Tax=Roseateles sp. TaxID=1971397 RepID=UPI0037C85766